jgi:pimeloyl-ACP methyl ester carboxylesterase
MDLRAVLLALTLTCTGANKVNDALLDMIPAHARGGKLWKSKVEATRRSSVFTNSTVNWFEQPIDHSDADSANFNQRYYIDTTYCEDMSSCPIFMYIGGEGTLSATPGGYTTTIAQEHGALIYALEHRWYGESLPGDITSTDDLTSLTVENALADLRNFMEQQQTGLGSSGTRTWLMIGGSYPGALSAWFRLKNPDIAAASWSSSGVILAVENFTQFDVVETEAVGDDCAQALRDVTSAFETAWDAGGDEKQALLDLFGTPDDFTKGDMAWMLADSAAMGPQYGSKIEMCSYLVPESDDVDVLAAFANWTNDHYGTSFGSSCYYSTACLSDPTRVDEWYDTKSWVWQCCHQLEYWQVAYPNSLRSQELTYDYFMNQCKAAFGDDFPQADIKSFNDEYEGLNPDSTLVIALNGGDDPWRGCTQNETKSDDYPENTAFCDGCGHCGDLGTTTKDSPPELIAQQNLIQQYIAEWIN